MQIAQVRNVVALAPKGANIILEWTRPCKVRKGTEQDVQKAVRMVGRVGVSYENLASVKEKRENGELPKVSQGLPSWAEWVEAPFLMRHIGSGQLYLRLYKGTSKKTPPHVQFLADGEKVEREAVEDVLLASEKKGHGNTDTFMVKIESLDRIYSETAEYGSLHG